MVVITSTVEVHCTPCVVWDRINVLQNFNDVVLVLPFRTKIAKRFVQTIGVGLVMLRVMNFHGSCINVWLQRVVRVRHWRKSKVSHTDKGIKENIYYFL